jgi:hypothetical protein
MRIGGRKKKPRRKAGPVFRGNRAVGDTAHRIYVSGRQMVPGATLVLLSRDGIPQSTALFQVQDGRAL